MPDNLTMLDNGRDSVLDVLASAKRAELETGLGEGVLVLSDAGDSIYYNCNMTLGEVLLLIKRFEQLLIHMEG